MSKSEGLLVQIASYNTNLQGEQGVPQDLVDWLAPSLQVSSFLQGSERGLRGRAPDIVAVGFQELLPLHLGLSGLSTGVIRGRDKLILSQVEQRFGKRYRLVGKEVNVGVAVLVYAVEGLEEDAVQTAWSGCGPLWMGNKGAVGVRFKIAGEVFTFVNCHLTAHAHKNEERLKDWDHLVGTLLFGGSSTLYETSHLFVFGDLNFRLDIPKDDPIWNRLPVKPPKGKSSTSEPGPATDTTPLLAKEGETLAQVLSSPALLKELSAYDQLVQARESGRAFRGLEEAPFWAFKCSYKFKIGHVDKYDTKRMVAWTDRVMWGSFQKLQCLIYTSVPGYTTSDHKPIVSLFLVPPPPSFATSPRLVLPRDYTPTVDPLVNIKRYTGRALDRVIGIVWWVIVLLGAGSGALGLVNFALGFGAVGFFKRWGGFEWVWKLWYGQ